MWMRALFGEERDGCWYVMGALGNAGDGERLSAVRVVVFCVSCVCMVVSCRGVLWLVVWWYVRVSWSGGAYWRWLRGFAQGRGSVVSGYLEKSCGCASRRGR
jgi:hypothetical protein